MAVVYIYYILCSVVILYFYSISQAKYLVVRGVDVLCTAVEVASSTFNTDTSVIQFWRSTHHTTWTVFAVRACSNIQIVLTAVMHSLNNEYTYLIDLQGQDNMTSMYTW